MALDILAVILGVVGTPALFGAVYWDAGRTDVSRPLLWASVAAVPLAVGVAMHLFATVPTTGVIMTANTGLVLYGFERELSLGDEEPAEPGELPHK
ncbi:hypothetical protein OB905_03290 [Halobacteria archaeon AArc-dxtr1]|nr:hypothetical protein [Halobacteria archaeon AArc-dxtr1]